MKNNCHSERHAQGSTVIDNHIINHIDNQHQHQHQYQFPNPLEVDPEGFGLIAMGGDLSPQTLLAAYTQGLFPWFNEDEPIAWWCPDPRCVFVLDSYQPSKSLKRQVKSSPWQWSVNRAFTEVMHACSLPRSYADDTWIHEEMIEAYTKLHELGYAHSIEIWDNDDLIGGLYGIKIGQIYFGESMFHTQSNASKIAFWALNVLCQQTQVALIDCQLPNPHLQRLGADIMPREAFLRRLPTLITQASLPWHPLSKLSADTVNNNTRLAVSALVSPAEYTPYKTLTKRKL